MRKNMFLILLLAALFVFVGVMNKSARATNEAVEFIENAKTPVTLHSLAGGTICIPGISDSLVHTRPTQVCTWWHSLYPIQTYCHNWHVIDQYENGIPGLNPSDWIRLEHVPTGPGDSIWVHVEDVTITLILTLEPNHICTTYVEFERSYKDVDTFFVPYAIYPPVIGDTLHEIWPEWSRVYQLTSWIDSGFPYGKLSCSDTIDLTEWWHVINVNAEEWHVTNVDSLTTGFFLKLDRLGNPSDTMRARFSGGVVPDSVHRARVTPVCTWWQEQWPQSGKWWHIVRWRDNGNNYLNPCDTITIIDNTDLILTMEDRDGEGANRTLTFSGGTHPDSIYRALHNPISTWWHEAGAPPGCDWWHIASWTDNGNGILDSCDIIDFVTWWHVEDVAIDIDVLSGPVPRTPTMTQWGVVVLAALIVISAVYIMLRRRRATVAA